MTYIKWTFRVLIFLIVAGLLHYNLPDRDIVRIVNTEVKRVDYGWNAPFWQNASSGDAAPTANSDIFFIETIRPDESPLVFRNEDTGWGWPPYFKFDTADLQTEARNLISDKDDPTWVAVRHYGWRSQLGSIFPNATSLKVVDGPDVRLIPWFNIVFLTILFVIFATLWRLWVNFRRARIDPMLEDVGEGVEAAERKMGSIFDRFLKPKK